VNMLRDETFQVYGSDTESQPQPRWADKADYLYDADTGVRYVWHGGEWKVMK